MPYFITVVMLLVSCAKEPVELLESKPYGDELILGERLANPYAIDNMNSALNELDRPAVEANKKYVRFLIGNEEQMTQLKAINLQLFDHPLDYEVKENGAVYKSGSKDNKEKYYYSVVPKDFAFPNSLPYELLSDLYIPEKIDVELEQKAFEILNLEYTPVMEKSVFGNVSFEEITDGNMVPLKDLKIIAREWFRFEVVNTDESGNFVLNKNYFSDAEIYVQFDNELFEFRSFDEKNLLLLLLPNFYSLGYNDASSSINILLNESNFNSSKLLMTASAYSAYSDYMEFADLNNMLLPEEKLLVWMAENEGVLSTGNAAPMLRALASDDLSNIRNLLKNLFNFPDFLANPIANILKNDVPDLFLLYDKDSPTQKESTWYHEYAHVSHYAQVGADIWLPYIQHIVENGGYGGPDGSATGIVALSEAWAEDASQFCHEWKFGYAEENLENLGPNDSDWIPYGLYNDLIDDNNAANENDNVSGYSLNQLYALLQSDVSSPELLKSSILSTIDDPALINAINALFEDYGY